MRAKIKRPILCIDVARAALSKKICAKGPARKEVETYLNRQKLPSLLLIPNLWNKFSNENCTVLCTYEKSTRAKLTQLISSATAKRMDIEKFKCRFFAESDTPTTHKR